MSFFSRIKDFFSRKRQISEFIKAEAERTARYLAMNTEELSALSDDELFSAAISRTASLLDPFDDYEKGLDSMNESQRVFCSVNWFDSEINNGGLCQYFVNSSRVTAPFISDCLGKIGAFEHKKLYDGFIKRNGIDTKDLSAFDIGDLSEFEEKNKMYPFDEFDDAFYELEPLESFLKKYARDHIEDL